MTDEPTLYAEDLAWIHHRGFTRLAEAVGPSVVQLLHRHGIEDGRVVDLGCGSGVLLGHLIANGFEGWGVDPSPAFLSLAREVAPDARLLLGSALEVELPRCRAVTAVGEVLSYLPPGPEALPGLFRRVASALEPGGLFLFDLIQRDVSAPMRYRTWEAGEGWAVLVEVEEDVAARAVTRRIVTFREVAGVWRRASEEHRVFVVDSDEVEESLRDAGFSVDRRPGYLEALVPARRVVFVARLR